MSLSYGKKQLMVHRRPIQMVEEEEWAIFFTYEHVHFVHVPETLERAHVTLFSRAVLHV